MQKTTIVFLECFTRDTNESCKRIAPCRIIGGLCSKLGVFPRSITAASPRTTMVRGFAPNGFGPRDLTPGTTMDNVGGSMYWATTAELQSNIPGVPQEYGLKASAFVDAGSVFRYSGPTAFPGSAQSLQVANNNIVRSSVGVGLTWASPFGALTVNYAVPLTKAAYDVVQPLSFGAGGF